MAQLKTSILLELQDKFSRSFKELEKSLVNTKTKGGELAKSISKTSKELVGGGNQFKNYNKEVKNTESSFKDLSETMAQGFGALKIGSMIKNQLAEAGNRQMLGIKLSTVIGDNDQKEFEDYFKQVEATGIASFQEIVDTGYNLLSVGLNGNQAKLGAKNVIDVATVTGGQADLVASTMATASKNFNMDMARVGDILAKTQLKFQFANFGQLGAGFDMVGSSASAIKLPLEQTATALGMLNDAGITGSSAGTALNAVLRQMNVASKKLGVDITRSADGSLDLVEFLKQIDSKTKGFNLDQKAAIFQEIFGDEGKRGLLPLIANLDKMSANLEDVTKNSKGITNQEVAKYYEAYNTKVAKFSNTLSQLAGTIGNLLLPIVGSLLDVFSQVIQGLDYAITKFPALGYAFLGVAGAIGVFMGVMAFAKVLRFFFALTQLSAILPILRTAIMFTTGAIRAMTLAMVSNPIGALIFVLTTGAVLLITYWSEVKEFFVGFFDWLSNNGFFKMMDKGISVAKSLFSSS
jgi:TP901 family phage tail tape measure protein